MSELSEHRFLELKATGDLPSPTGVALNVLEQLQNKAVSCSTITNTIQADPALAGRLLKLANDFDQKQHGARPTVSLAETIARVGPGVTRHITLGLSVLSASREGQCDAFDYDNFWSYSLAMGIATELLSEREKRFPKDEAFTVGLLSNVGRMALANVYPDQYTNILNCNDANQIQVLLAEERHELNTDHLEMAHALLKDWGLPSVHYDAIPGMYQPNLVSHRNERTQALARYLQLSTQIAALFIADAEHSDRSHSVFDLAADMGMSAAETQQLLKKTRELWHDWADLFQVQDGEEDDVDQLDAPIELEQTQDQTLRILIADDDQDTLNLLKHHLSQDGHTISTTTSGKQALKMALEDHPHCVISDWFMPDMNGLDLCEQLRDTRVGQKIYFIVLTAHTEEEHLVSAFRAGVDDFIEKPLKPNVLLARIRGGQRLFQLHQAIEREQKENRRILGELKKLNQNLEQAALSDALTGIPNRRYATSRLHQEWADSNRDLTPLSVLLVDVDHFKSVNDTYGHDVGDRVLCDVAQTLRTAARAGDVVCRIGGEEFLVICANTNLAEAQSTAERLRRAVEELHVEEIAADRNITISVGVAVRDEADEHENALLKAADQAVYVAKSSGRNCVQLSASRTATEETPVNLEATQPRPPQPVEVTELA